MRNPSTLLLAHLLCALLACCLWSCHSDNDNEPTPMAERSVLVYMVANCNLGGDADINDLAEMRMAALDGRLGNNNWIIYHSTKKGSRLLSMGANGDTTLIKAYPQGYSVTIDRMTEVISDFKFNAPANSYGIVFWSHGTGWIEDGIDEGGINEISPKSYGDDGGKKMNVTSMRRALENMGLDYIYFDCCLMGSIEVAYELRNCARYIVSSPSELPWDGMRYDLNFAELLDGSREALIRAAQNTFNHYNSQTSSYDRSCTMSVIDTRQLDKLAEATAEIYKITPLQHPLSIVTNYYGSETSRQAFYLDFGEYVNALCASHDVAPTLAKNFNDALSAAVIYKAATESIWNWFKMYSVSGLSTRVFHLPSAIYEKGYNNLQWTKDIVIPYHIEQTSNN